MVSSDVIFWFLYDLTYWLFFSHILGILQVPISELFSFVTEHGNWSRYAWVLAKCNTCQAIGVEKHMGWHFKAIDSNMHPKSFWGIWRTQLIGSHSQV
jgi:hypothetical protein